MQISRQLSKSLQALFITSMLGFFADSAMAAAGGLDATFGGGNGWINTSFGGSDSVFSVIQQSDGKLVAVGVGYYNFALARYNASGTLDTSFNGMGKVTTSFGGIYANAYSVIQQSDGKLVVAGNAYNGVSYDFALARYNTNGTLDAAFNGTGKVTTNFNGNDDGAQSVIQQSDGKLVLAGYAYNGSNYDFALVRYNTNGTLDITFNGTGKVSTAIGSANDYAYSVIQQSDGKLVVAGSARMGSTDDFTLVRYNANGTLDTSFNGTGKMTTDFSGGNDVAYSVIQQSDGKLAAAGYTVGSNYDFALVRYNPGGSLDTTFNGMGKVTTAVGSVNDGAYSVIQQSDGKLVVAGYSTNGSNNDFGLVRYNLNGSLDTTFNGTGKVTTAIGTGDDVAKSIIQQSDGKLVAAGYANNMPSGQEFIVVRYESGQLIGDTDGDGMSDAWEIQYGLSPLVNDANGDLDGDHITNLQEYINGTNPTIPNVKNDFSADGNADVLLRNLSTGDWNLAQLNGLTILNQGSLSGAFSDVDNVIVSTADFNGDGTADILTRGTASGLIPGTFYIDLMSGMNAIDSNWLLTMSADLNDEVVSTKDFNKDGKADVLLRNKITGVWMMNYMNGTGAPTITTLNASIDTCYTMQGDGDYDGNGYPDLLLRKDHCGGASNPWLMYATDGSTTPISSGALNMAASPAWGAFVTDKDFNNDGKSDVLMRAITGTTQQWVLYNLNGVGAPTSGLVNIATQSLWQFKSEGDFNADGKTDLLLRNSNNGQWYIYLLNNTVALSGAVPAINMNPQWDIQAMDDYNGDGKSDVLIRNTSSGQWYMNLINGTAVQSKALLTINSDLSYVLQND